MRTRVSCQLHDVNVDLCSDRHMFLELVPRTVLAEEIGKAPQPMSTLPPVFIQYSKINKQINTCLFDLRSEHPRIRLEVNNGSEEMITSEL